MLASLDIQTAKKNELLDITALVQEELSKSGLKNGLCVVWVPHTTAALAVNENADPAVRGDILSGLDRVAPENGPYRHSEGNSDGHIKSVLVGPGVSFIVERGRLLLGTWQGVYFCEFDGPRARKVFIKTVPG